MNLSSFTLVKGFSYAVAKSLSRAAVILAVPVFAVYALMTGGTGQSSVEISPEHDPLRNGVRVVDQPVKTNLTVQAMNKASAVETVETPNWVFTRSIGPEPSGS